MGAKSRVCSLHRGICVSAPDGINSIILHGLQTHTCACMLTQPFARLAGVQGLCTGWGHQKATAFCWVALLPWLSSKRLLPHSAHPSGVPTGMAPWHGQELLALVSRHSPSALNQAILGGFSHAVP